MKPYSLWDKAFLFSIVELMGMRSITFYLLILIGTISITSTVSSSQSLRDSTIVMGTPYDIENGKGFVRNYYINYNLVGIGIGEHAFLKAGFGIIELLSLGEQAYYVQPSFQFPISDLVKIDIGFGLSQYHREFSSRTIDLGLSTPTKNGLLQVGMSFGLMKNILKLFQIFLHPPHLSLIMLFISPENR